MVHNNRVILFFYLKKIIFGPKGLKAMYMILVLSKILSFFL